MGIPSLFRKLIQNLNIIPWGASKRKILPGIAVRFPAYVPIKGGVGSVSDYHRRVCGFGGVRGFSHCLETPAVKQDENGSGGLLRLSRLALLKRKILRLGG